MKRITFGKGVQILPNEPGDPLSFQASKYERPRVTKIPAIVGTGTVGVAQTRTPGVWTSGTVTWEWWLNGQVVQVGGAYTPVAGDSGKTLTLLERATATNGLGATSRSIGVQIP